jgi:hypothetical protein
VTEEDASHPQAQVPENIPTAEMPHSERLALWAELNPPGSTNKNDPQADWDNDDWYRWVNFHINDVVNPEASTYEGPNKGQYWMTYAAVEDPHGDLPAFPAYGDTQAVRHAYIHGSTSDGFAADWVGDVGDTERVMITDVETNSGELRERVRVRMKLVQEAGRAFILASIDP